jgi:hypothetical protein
MPSSQNHRSQIHRPGSKDSIPLPGRSVSVRALTLAITTALFITAPASAQAGTPPAALNLSELDGSNGFVLNGGAVYDRSGISVSAAGDVNGDGIDDVIVGASRADPNGINSGAAYVIFGSTGGLPSPLVPSALDGTNGFLLNGEAGNDEAGSSVSAAGDINGDGIDDLIIGASGADPNGDGSGRSYVVFGSNTGFPASLDLSTLNGINGFVLNGEAAGDGSGDAVSAAGDVNGDGIDDLIIGADDAGPNGEASGRSYVVFGSDKGFQSPFNLSTLDGSNGFAMNGAAMYDNAGRSVSSAGDFNGDGIDDVIIGASGEDAEEYSSGRAYLVFGSLQPFPTPIDLISLNGTNGSVLTGLEENTGSLFNVSAAGDVNGDGLDDLIIGDSGSRVSGITLVGRSYVIFGSKSGLPSPFNMSALNGSNGFVLNGEAALDGAGRSVSGAGDVDGDGIDDFIIGANEASPNGSNSGRSYVVFGSESAFPNPFNLGNLDGSNGFALNGEAAFDRSGGSVSGAGDVNGDGIGDVIIGAFTATPNGTESGRSYVVFGIRQGVFADRFEAP